jgi:predicted RNA-binding protein YlqC (UPF0109 family)
VPRLNREIGGTKAASKQVIHKFMRETVEMIVRALVDDAEAVDVREIERDGTTRIEVRVAQPDMGKVIGKQGRTVRALRSLVYAAGLKKHRRFILDVVE